MFHLHLHLRLRLRNTLCLCLCPLLLCHRPWPFHPWLCHPWPCHLYFSHLCLCLCSSLLCLYLFLHQGRHKLLEMMTDSVTASLRFFFPQGLVWGLVGRLV